MIQRNFLSRVLPTLPPPGLFGEQPCYFGLNLKSDGNGGLIRDQKPCSNYDSICSFANTGSSSGFDSYVALASFESPLGGRKQNNASACRVIWADIDAGKYKSDGTLKSKYRDQKEALQELIQFSNKTGLEPTLVVSSGMGLHSYWTFDVNIAPEPWAQLASLFFQLCKQEGLDVDNNPSRDIARVLRIPNTLHQKSGRVVQVLADSRIDYKPTVFLKQLVSCFKATTTIVAPPTIIHTNQSSNSSIATLMGMGPQLPSANAEKIINSCHQIATMGHGLYPQWFAAMSVLRRCVDGSHWAHKLSAMDPCRYDPNVTEKKFLETAEDAPARCLVFETENPIGCSACPHKGTIKSPVQLTHWSDPPTQCETGIISPAIIPLDSPEAIFIGQRPQLIMPTTGEWSMPYIGIQSYKWKVDHRGTIWIDTKKDSNGNFETQEHIVTSIQLWFKYSAHRNDNGVHHTIHYFDAIFPNQKVRELRIVAREDMTEHKIMQTLQATDIIPKSPVYNGKVFMGFFNAYLDSVMNVKKIVPIVKEFGWTKFDDPVSKQNVQGFVVGSGIITDTGIHPVGHEPGTTGIYADRAFSHAGTLDEWKHIPRMYMTLNQQFSVLCMCLGLASPLMKFGLAEAKNCYVNLFSEAGGKGKSTLMRAIHSIWGNPVYAFGSPNSSVSQRGKAMSVWNNLPYFVDEVTRMKNEDMNNMVYVLAGGMDKDRLKSNADLTMTGQWSMFTMSTANRSVKEALSKHAGGTDATLLRVIEFECDFPDYSNTSQVQRYISAVCDVMEKNYGLAGPEFMFQLLQHPERMLTLRSLVDSWRIKHGFKDNERYMSFPLGIAIHVARWAVEWGIFEFDIDALEQWVLKTLVPFNREHTADLSPDFLNNMTVYLNSRLPSMLQVRRDKREPDETDGLRPGMYDKYIIKYPQYNELTSRWEQENNVLYIATSDFKRWCDSMNMSPSTMVKNLAYHGILLENARINLGAHVSWLPTSRMRCYVIRGDSLDKLGWKPSTVSQVEAPTTQGGINGIDLGIHSTSTNTSAIQ